MSLRLKPLWDRPKQSRIDQPLGPTWPCYVWRAVIKHFHAVNARVAVTRPGMFLNSRDRTKHHTNRTTNNHRWSRIVGVLGP